MLRRLLAPIAATLLLGAVASVADAQIYPTRPVHIVVGFPAGSTTDILARIYADKLTEYFNQRFIVENIPGHSSNDAAATAAIAEPDGYTLFVASNAQSANAAILPEQPFAFPHAFAPIALLGRVPTVVVVNRALGVGSVRELVALAKAKPGTLRYGTSGLGTGGHLAAQLFKAAAGVSMVQATYDGSHEAAADLVAGRLDVLFAPLPTIAGIAADRRIVQLATTGARRSPVAPQLPTLAEEGIAGVDVGLWFGLMAPRGIPGEIQREIANAVTRAVDSHFFKDNLTASGAEPVRATLDTFAAFLEIDMPVWAVLVSKAGVSVADYERPAVRTAPTLPVNGH
ncbi:Bug family tripartite tricarboxylate transporter substrate binding protein [Rhodoplanes azumiensis]|uniref:Bug family tripartite tricarboxylate transporter substrate binding protein n=1 Tax=Rhodoplanes azumiensis TaxID=1897628 RepID=A0ABW5ADT8_9BRAD